MDKPQRQLKPGIRKAILAAKIYGSLFVVLLAGIPLIRHLLPEMPDGTRLGITISVTIICICIMLRLVFLARSARQKF